LTCSKCKEAGNYEVKKAAWCGKQECFIEITTATEANDKPSKGDDSGGVD
jgi:hypothetical protein